MDCGNRLNVSQWGLAGAGTKKNDVIGCDVFPQVILKICHGAEAVWNEGGDAVRVGFYKKIRNSMDNNFKPEKILSNLFMNKVIHIKNLWIVCQVICGKI